MNLKVSMRIGGSAFGQGFRAGTLIVALAASGCAGVERRPAPLVRTGIAAPIGFPRTVRAAAETRREFQAQAAPLLARVRDSTALPIRILALSGGGAGGAFGAGALVGWTQAGTRPQFQVVTGVSAGALIAPFAFLGSDWDAQLSAALSGDSTRQLLKIRWAGFISAGSLYRGEPLAALVDRFVSSELVHAVAAQAAKGRLLLVATTDLDRAQTVTWNLGAIAAQGGESARELFRDVLIASASVPGLFPPVLIRVEEPGGKFEEMHVDGGTTGSVFIAPEVASIAPQALDALQGAQVFVLVNGQFGTLSETTPVETLAILRRSLTAAFSSNYRAAVELAASIAPRYRMDVEVTAIPDDYPYRGPLDFDPPRMRALFEFGRRCAIARQIWAPPLEVLERAARGEPGVGEPLACPAAPRARARERGGAPANPTQSPRSE